MVDRLGRLLVTGDVVTTEAGWRMEVRSLEGRRAGRIAVRAPQLSPGGVPRPEERSAGVHREE
jgi:hypothetical protein